MLCMPRSCHYQMEIQKKKEKKGHDVVISLQINRRKKFHDGVIFYFNIYMYRDTRNPNYIYRYLTQLNNIQIGAVTLSIHLTCLYLHTWHREKVTKGVI